ncbi:phosphopantetheine-binding protein, partial [Streptosporangium sandarakinum]
EAALHRLPGVREAVAVKHDTGDRLVAYVVPAGPGGPLDTADVRRDLAEWLPDYMVPQAVVSLESLPLTPHGKADRRALAARPLPAQAPAAQAEPDFRTDAERLMAALWCDVLQITSVSRDDSFFDLGGDSLQAMRLATRARERGIRLGADDLFEYDVLHELAAWITETGEVGA